MVNPILDLSSDYLERDDFMVIFLNVCIVGRNVSVVMGWSLVNWRESFVDRRWILITRGEYFGKWEEVYFYNWGRGILVIYLCITSRV